MGQADMKSVADVVALEEERQKRANEADAALSTAGGMLRAAREAMGLGLADVAARTNIKEANLAAIEAMDTAALPSQPYTMGFVRAYAREVSLPEEALMERFREQAGYVLHDRATTVTAPKRSGQVESGRELSVIVLIVVLGLILWAAWTLLITAAPDVPEDSSRFSFSKDDQAPVVAAPESAPTESTPGDDLVAALVAQADAEAQASEGEAVDVDEQPTGTVPATTEPATTEPETAVVTQPVETVPVEDVVAEPIRLRRLVSVDPVYPPLCEASAEAIETVTVSYGVNSRGRPISTAISRSTNPCFNGAALAAISRWRYDPDAVTRENGRGLTAQFTFDRPY